MSPDHSQDLGGKGSMNKSVFRGELKTDSVHVPISFAVYDELAKKIRAHRIGTSILTGTSISSGSEQAHNGACKHKFRWWIHDRYTNKSHKDTHKLDRYVAVYALHGFACLDQHDQVALTKHRWYSKPIYAKIGRGRMDEIGNQYQREKCKMTSNQNISVTVVSGLFSAMWLHTEVC